ncbi:hypothetical protein R1sor_019790 [Riccia sorocarpa]|uniref:Reverse transcriptase domain-containing protein n=1 Tax=Riccia sorocarpa TaxID=122646 RepID=A0ABD3IDH8_9MARC
MNSNPQSVENQPQPESKSLPDTLIQQLALLEVAVPVSNVNEPNFVAEPLFLTNLILLATTAVYTFCYEGDITLEAFRSWAGQNWTRSKGIKIKETRKIAPFAFLTVVESEKKRDEALSIEIASIRTSTAAHFTWTLECENQSFKPAEVPTWLKFSGIPSWLKESVPGILKSTCPVLRLPLATKDLSNLVVVGGGKVGPSLDKAGTQEWGILMGKVHYFKVAILFLNKPGVKEPLKSSWDASIASSSNNGLQLFIEAWSVLRMKIKTLQYAELAKLLELDQMRVELEQLSVNPQMSAGQQTRVLELSEQVSRLQAWQEHRWRTWSRERYLTSGDTNSPFFLKRFKTRRRKNRINVLVSDQGHRVTSENGIRSQNRSVQGNVLLFCFLHEALKRERKSASVLMLNFAKAFDSLRHDFIFEGLKALGFSPFFVQLIRSITEGGFARVVVNSRLTPEFPIDKGVRQGCPLAPLLYVLITSSLIHHVDWGVAAGWLKRVTTRSCPSDIPVVSAFADDTAFFLQTDEGSFNQLFLLLNIFSQIAGCGINWRKTKYMVVGRFLLQSMLPYSLALLKFQQKDLHALERLLAVFLWGSAENGKTKTTLVAWKRLALPVDFGGAGVWCIRAFQKANITKLIFNKMEDLDSLWTPVFWSLFSRDTRQADRVLLLQGDILVIHSSHFGLLFLLFVGS